ncbi:hypothetical protein C6P40_002084 [Pichia californica]|uniref:RNA polymerase II subunit B1 CTD phosphatase RPAP2 homolog n=1 Tax=Pichia californica TaxID=460514 RepID=A0A9P6WIA0_9ASCO|nr:hypothetical protein C6P42_002091 [[Candida] californica]KAG0687625.1 hypothetical protein C6P40_002084 [[Candida] californica]
MDGITVENTEIDENTLTIEKLYDFLLPILNKHMLTPKEANQLTYNLTEQLISNNCDSKVLRLLARYLSKKSYEDITEERIIEHYCGYPLCKFNDPKKIKDIEINSLVKKLKMPRYYNSKFCCKNHYICSEFYKNQLGFDALFMRINLDKPWFSEDSIENHVVLLDEYINMKEKGVDMDDLNTVIDMLRSMNVKDSTSANLNLNSNLNSREELIEHFENFKVIEHNGKQKSDDVYGNKS